MNKKDTATEMPTITYELCESANQLEAIRPLLAAQSREEKRLFSMPELLTHADTSNSTLSLLLNFWAKNSGISCIKAVINDCCVGFICVQIKADFYNNQTVNVGEVVAIYVSDDVRKRGIATELMQRAEQLLVAAGVHAINTAWLKGNQASQKLYERCGFTPVMVSARKLIK